MPRLTALAFASLVLPLFLGACSDGRATGPAEGGELAVGFFDYSLTDPRPGGPVYTGTMQVTLLRPDSMAAVWIVPGMMATMEEGSGGFSSAQGGYLLWVRFQAGGGVSHVLGRNLSCSATVALLPATCRVTARP